MPDVLDLLRRSWIRSLRSENAPPATITTYDRGVRMFLGFLAEPPALTLDEDEESPAQLLARLPVDDVSDLRRVHIEAFRASLFAAGKAANTVATYFAAVSAWLKWMVKEPDLDLEVSPAAGMNAVQIPDVEIAIIPIDHIRRILATCDKKTFIGARDDAMMRLFGDTGIRAGEMCGLRAVDEIDGKRVPFVDLESCDIYVWAKGRRTRSVAFGDRTALALLRYLRFRSKHPHADDTAFWLVSLNRAGGLTYQGVRHMLDTRCERAGVPHYTAHQWRHTWADAAKRSGLPWDDMKRQGGWRSDKIAARYGAAAAEERAREAHRRHSFGNTF